MKLVFFSTFMVLCLAIIALPVIAQDIVYLPLVNSQGLSQASTNTPSLTPTPTNRTVQTVTSTSTEISTLSSTTTVTPISTPSPTFTVTPIPTSASTFTTTPTATTTPCSILQGILQSDTTLVSGCNYNVTNNILVPAGITLSVPSDITLRFNPEIYMLVNGSLIVSGTVDAPSRFTGTDSLAWGGVKIQQSDGLIPSVNSINHLVIEYAQGAPSIETRSALYIGYAKASISNVTFQYNASPFYLRGDRGYGPVSIRNSEVMSNTLGAVLMYPDSSIDKVIFSNNNISEDYSAVLTVCQTSYIRNSSFLNNTTAAIRTTGCNSPTLIENNVIAGNDGVIVVALSNPTVTLNSNDIYNNRKLKQPNNNSLDALIYTDCGLNITNNNIYGNTALHVMHSKSNNCESAPIDATSNWWGTTITSEIGSLIYDYDDDFTLGKIIYEPFSIKPN